MNTQYPPNFPLPATTLSRYFISLLMHPSPSLFSLAPRRLPVLRPAHQGDEKKNPDVSITRTFIRANCGLCQAYAIGALFLVETWQRKN